MQPCLRTSKSLSASLCPRPLLHQRNLMLQLPIEQLVPPCHTPFLDRFATQPWCTSTPFRQCPALSNCCHRRDLPTACRDAACPLPRIMIRSARKCGKYWQLSTTYLRSVILLSFRNFKPCQMMHRWLQYAANCTCMYMHWLIWRGQRINVFATCEET